MKPDLKQGKETKEPALNIQDAKQDEGREDDHNYLGRAWEAVKESVGVDQVTDRQDAEREKIE